jgi:hypothetical protein
MFPKVLRLEVIALLCVKAAALVAIYYLFMAPHTVPQPNGETMRRHILSH